MYFGLVSLGLNTTNITAAMSNGMNSMSNNLNSNTPSQLSAKKIVVECVFHPLVASGRYVFPNHHVSPP
jgi:hypothetical protein